jgi:hypothetical protein
MEDYLSGFSVPRQGLIPFNATHRMVTDSGYKKALKKLVTILPRRTIIFETANIKIHHRP